MATTTTQTPKCACARNTDGSTTTMLCPLHADTDPCLTFSQVTGKRRKGTIRKGTCTNCGWFAATVNPTPGELVDAEQTQECNLNDDGQPLVPLVIDGKLTEAGEVYVLDQRRFAKEESVPAIKCDMRAECETTATYLGAKGYVYCAEHREERKGWEATRPMKGWEMERIRAGKALLGWSTTRAQTKAYDEKVANAI